MRFAWLWLAACSSANEPATTTKPVHVPAATTDAAVAVPIPADAAADEPPRIELAVVHAFGGIDLVESVNSATFMHGGSPARLTHASIKFEVRDARAHRIDVSKLALVEGCRRGTKTTRPLVIEELQAYAFDGDVPVARGDASVTLPARGPERYAVIVSFKSASAVDSACGYDVAMIVDRVPHRAELPLRIKRIEPIE